MIFMFISIGGNDPIWLLFFQLGWDHQVELVVWLISGDDILPIEIDLYYAIMRMTLYQPV